VHVRKEGRAQGAALARRGVRLPRTADGGDEAGHYRRGFWVEGQAMILRAWYDLTCCSQNECK